MKLYVMRHGEAAWNAPSDAERPLTEHGRDEARCMGQWLSTMEPGLTHAWVSPYLRARQTLEQITDQWPRRLNTTTHDALIPMGHPGKLVDELAATAVQQQPGSLLLVSHMPLVSELVAQLVPGCEPPLFVTGAIAAIDWQVESYRGSLEILHTPWQSGLKTPA